MDLSKHLETAADAVKRRNYPLAIKTYNMVLSLQPDNGEARAGLRAALFKKNEHKPSSKLFAVLGGGVHLLGAGFFKLFKQQGAAAKSYERYLTLDPKAEGANLKLGNALLAAGHRDSALAVFKAYADEQPRCLEACRSAGDLLSAKGDIEDAMLMYERALKVDPRDQQSLKARKDLAALGALKKTGLESAESSRDLIRDQEQARRLEKSDRLQLSKEEIDKEIDELEKKLQESPDDGRLWVRMADLLEMDNDLSGALDALSRALSGDAGNSDLQNRAGHLRLRMQERKVEEARARGDDGAVGFAEKALLEARLAEYRRQVAQNPTDLALRHQLGKALVGAEEFDDGIAELQQSVKDPRSKGEALLLLGQAFAKKGLNDVAMGQLEKALEAVGAGRQRNEILYVMGCVAEDVGQTKTALSHFTQILEQDIGFRDVAQKVDQLKASLKA